MFLSTLRRGSDAVLPTWGAMPPLVHRPAHVAERRAAPRHETEIDARLCVMGREHDCTIRNVSTRGMTVTLDTVDLCVGIQVLVTFGAMRRFCGTVRWFRGRSIGIEFVKPLTLDQVYDMRRSTPAGMQPRVGRGRVKLPATARLADRNCWVEILNISVGGLMMAAGFATRPGQRLMIEFPDMLPMGGHVRWSSAGACGVMFSKLLPIPAAQELARRGGLSDAWLDEVRMVHRTALTN